MKMTDDIKAILRRLNSSEEKTVSNEDKKRETYRRKLLCSKCGDFIYHEVYDINNTRIIECGECGAEHVLNSISQEVGWVDEQFGKLGLLFLFFGTKEMAKILTMVEEDKVDTN